MEFRKLGRSELEISRVCLGTMTYGVQTSDEDAFAQMDMAVKAGVNCFDTAELYPVLPISKETQGESERIIGRWLKSRTNRDVLVFSKIAGIRNNTARDGSPITPAAINSSLERSLRNLGREQIDLYQLHWPNRPHYHFRNFWNFRVEAGDAARYTDEFLEILEALEKAKKMGKIREIGVSNDSSWGIMKMLAIAEKNGLPRIASVQNEYSLLHRIFEPDLQEVCSFEDVTLLTYSSLAAGILTGKYGRNGEHIPEGSRRSIERNLGGRTSETLWPIVAEYLELAAEYAIDPVHFAYRFCASQPFVGSIIIGATNQQQLKYILSDGFAPLSEEILTKIGKIRQSYPIPL